MNLTHNEYIEYLSTHLDLLFFTGQKMRIIPEKINYNDFLKLDLQTKFKCREAFLDNEKLLDEFIFTNSNRLTTIQIKILNGFKKMIRSDFVVLKYLSNYAVFINIKDSKFYAVKAIGDRFDELFDFIPVVISTVLLPYNDKIIYDGFIQSKKIYIGPEMRSTFNKDFQKAKKYQQFITTIS